MQGQPEENPNSLRVIKTARRKKAINLAARDGFRPLVKPVIPSRQIRSMMAIYQHQETGEIQLWYDLRYSPSDEWVLAVPHFHYYPYRFAYPFAAYLVPPDLGIGERVWLEDVIEDIVAAWGNQGCRPRLKHCEATWDGKEFIIHFDPEKDAEVWIG